jgi:serine/threonine protein kinase
MESSGVGDYKFLSVLGEGSFGKVFLAKDERNGNIVAVKRLRSNNKRVEAELIREVRALRAVSGCPRVLSYARFVRGTNNYYLVTDYVEGVNLSEFINGVKTDKYRVSNLDLLSVMIQLAEAIVCAHNRGVVHRDLKDENIIVNPETKPPTVTVIDFGLSCLVQLPQDPSPGDRLTWCGNPKGIAGNKRYYPNEIFQSGFTFFQNYPFESLDIFALGLLFLRIATGKVVSAIRPPKVVDTGSVDLDNVIDFLMLPKDPVLRVSAEEILEDLQNIVDPKFEILS